MYREVSSDLHRSELLRVLQISSLCQIETIFYLTCTLLQNHLFLLLILDLQDPYQKMTTTIRKNQLISAHQDKLRKIEAYIAHRNLPEVIQQSTFVNTNTVKFAVMISIMLYNKDKETSVLANVKQML